MKHLKRIFLLLFFSLTLLNANVQIAVKADKSPQDLYKDKQFLIEKLSNLVSKEEIKIISSSHSVWKWQLVILNIKNRENAGYILDIIKEKYHDAYFLNLKNRQIEPEDEIIEINFAGLSMKDFVKLVSKTMDKNILMPEKINGKVNFVGKQPIKKDKLLTLLNQTLLTNGYTIQDTQNGYLSIVKSSEAIKNGPPILGRSELNEVQSAVLTFKNVKITDIMKPARSLISKYGKVSIANNNNALIVTDFPQNIKAIRDIVQLLDQNNNTIVKFITLKNTDVQTQYVEISKMINSFFRKQSKNQQVQLIKNENSNSIALVGDRKDIAKILPYIKKLDRGTNKKEKDIELVYIKNADAKLVAELLHKLISTKAFNKNLENMSSETNSPNSRPMEYGSSGARNINTPNSPNPIGNEFIPIDDYNQDNKEKPNIVYDKQLNALMIFGTKKERDVLKNIIKQLDVERKQVYVKAKILEINNEKASQIGMQYGIVGGIADSSGIYALSNKMGLSDAGAALKLADTLKLQIPNVKNMLAIGAAISLLTNNLAANIISQPSILCINNEESSIYVGKTVSVVSQSSVKATTTDISQNVYNREDIGLTLKISPRISADYKVVLNTEISMEDILPGSMAGLPSTTKRVVKTSAIVKNGETIIIGGLVRNKENTSVTGIPVIRKIPIIGKLFQHENITNEKTTLVLMLTPYIVEHSEELTKLRKALGELQSYK